MIDIRKINTESFYTVSEVARMLDYKTNQSVYNLIESGKLKANKEGKNLIISGGSIAEYLKKEKNINVDENGKNENKLISYTDECERKLEYIEQAYQAGIYEKGYYEYAKKQIIENQKNPPRCPYCEEVLGQDSVFNRELNDTYHICKKCESILIKFLNRPRTVHNADIEEERKKIDDKLYFTLKGFANVFRVSMIDLNKQVLPYRLEMINKAIENDKIKTVEINGEVLIPADELYRILDICEKKDYTFNDVFFYEL